MKFYHPYSKQSHLDDLDQDWIDRLTKRSPFDIHTHFINALSASHGENRTAFLEKVRAIMNSGIGNSRISQLLERFNPDGVSEYHNIDVVEVKSKKLDGLAESSILFTGLAAAGGLMSDTEDEIIEINEIDLASSVSDENEKVAELTENSKEENPLRILEFDTIYIEDDVEEIGEKAPEILELETIELEDESPIDATQNDKGTLAQEMQIYSEKREYNSGVESDLTAKEGVDLEPEKEAAPAEASLDASQMSAFNNWLVGLEDSEAKTLPKPKATTRSTVATDSKVISEPLAALLIEQGHLDDAKKMYEQLMQKYPEKSSFFAEQINKISK